MERTLPRMAKSYLPYRLDQRLLLSAPSDLGAMMRSNQLPRLRYVWHHIAAFVNKGAAAVALPEGPYSAHFSR